ncbi:MAG: alpha/beta hydrolase [Agathobacter sp.]|nr:alpha/beta hydrolase [Agathobacter sp.]MBQ6812982.1 alpha/beta hydrolase [Agathobacter sp.]
MNLKSIKSDMKCMVVQKLVFHKLNPGVKVNDFKPRNCPGERLRNDGILYMNDICYGEKYPNSHLDIWRLDRDKIVKRPTVIYMHGGGCIFGDKVVGDPLAVGNGRDVDFGAELAKRGYNVITMNYALAPEYRFPVQIEQVDQMLSYLTEHSEELGLDMENVFLGGGSAGANLAEIYGTVLTCPEYAEILGIQPTIQVSQIKGLLIDEASLIATHYEKNMNAMFGSWVGDDEPAKSEKGKLLEVTKWIGDTYIPSFINSSNQEIWFEDSAKALVEVLERNGTDYEYFYRSPECDKLVHGYMQLFASNPYAKECFEHMIAFMERQMTK